MLTNSGNLQKQVTQGTLTSILSACKVQLLPAEKNNSKTIQSRTLANCLANYLSEEGVATFVSNNLQMGNCNILIYISVGGIKFNNFALRYSCNPSLALANSIQSYLWFKNLTVASIRYSIRQRDYELIRQGILPLQVIFPGNPTDLAVSAENYCHSIARAIAVFVHNTIHQNVVEVATPPPLLSVINPRRSVVTKP